MNALDLQKNALSLWQQVHGNESLDQQCQRFTGYYTQWAYQGHERGIRTYDSALIAARASTMRGYDINSAPVGSFLYWNIGQYGHDGLVIGHDNGRALVCYATRRGDTVLDLSHGVKISHADTYSNTTFMGWSYTNGANPPLTGLTAWDMAPARPLDSVRRVAAYLNTRGLGRTSSSAIDGVPGPNLYWMIQTAGTADGIYNGAIDGATGPKTEAAFDYYITKTTGTIPAEPGDPTPIPPDPTPVPKTWLDGIDISGWQEGIDLAAVSADFVIVKATQGTTFISDLTHPFMSSAMSLGKKVGIYHFADGSDVQAEAAWFLQNTKQYIGQAIPVLDFEGGALAEGADWALEWLQAVEKAWGVKPLLYLSGSESAKEQYRKIADAGFPLWRAAYGPNDPGGYELAPLDPTINRGVWPVVTMRQYLSTGRLPGWAGNLDLNIFYGVESDWDALVKVVAVDPVPPVPPVTPPADSTEPPKPKRSPGAFIGLGIVGLVTAIIGIIAWFNQ